MAILALHFEDYVNFTNILLIIFTWLCACEGAHAPCMCREEEFSGSDLLGILRGLNSGHRTFMVSSFTHWAILLAFVTFEQNFLGEQFSDSFPNGSRSLLRTTAHSLWLFGWLTSPSCSECSSKLRCPSPSQGSFPTCHPLLVFSLQLTLPLLVSSKTCSASPRFWSCAFPVHSLQEPSISRSSHLGIFSFVDEGKVPVSPCPLTLMHFSW